MKTAIPVALLAIPIFFHAECFAQSDSIYYHNHSFESQYGAAGAYPSTDYLQAVARFTPSFYPAKLAGVRAYFRNAADPAPYRFIMYTDPSGAATGPVGSPVYAGTVNTNPSSGGIFDEVYSSYLDVSNDNLIINAGDIYCGITQHAQMNGFVGAALDQVPQNNIVNDRQWISTSQGAAGSWFEIVQWTSGGQWGFTALFEYLTSVTSPFDEAHYSINLISDQLLIRIELNGKLLIYNSLGMEIYSSPFSPGSVAISTHKRSAGAYFIKLIGSDQVLRQKVVIH